MLSAREVWARVKTLSAFSKLSEFDFRPVYYVQKFQVAASTITGWAAQEFPNGAIIIGITAAQPNAAAANNRTTFGIDFQFSNTDAIVVGGPVCADTLLGGGELDLFPAREIIISPGNKVNARIENYSNASAISVHVTYHALTYRTTS
jgi:hypothetical protein